MPTFASSRVSSGDARSFDASSGLLTLVVRDWGLFFCPKRGTK